MNDRLHNLEIEYQRKKHQIEKEQFSCNHCWSQPQYDPEIQKKPTGYEIVAQGSDIYTIPCQYSNVQVPRWSRVCKKCGKVEYTYTTQPIIVGHEPKF